MKKGLYLTFITIITVVCIFVGIGIHDGFHFSFGNISLKNSKGNNSTKLEAFTEINLDADVMSVTVKQGEDYAITYNYTGIAEPTYAVEDGILYVKQKEKGFSIFGTGNRRCSMEITVPKDTKLTRVKMDTDVGDVKIKEVQLENTDLYSDVGNVSLNGIQFMKGTIETDTGNVQLEQCEFSDLHIETDVGNTKISTVSNVKNYDVDLKTDVGKVYVNGQSQGTEYHNSGDEMGNISVEGDIGDVSLVYE